MGLYNRRRIGAGALFAFPTFFAFGFLFRWRWRKSGRRPAAGALSFQFEVLVE